VRRRKCKRRMAMISVYYILSLEGEGAGTELGIPL
jgi:hypothetical protein